MTWTSCGADENYFGNSSFHPFLVKTKYLRMSLQDDHIWNLAQRFKDESEILNLGLQVLKLRAYQVDSIWNKRKPDANLTARELLQKWLLQFENRTEAYMSLYDALTKNDMNQLAALLRKWVEGSGPEKRQLSIERT